MLHKLSLIAIFALGACTSTPAYTPPRNVDASIEQLMTKYNAASVGIGIIRHGELVWVGYYGEQSPGVPIGPQSMFNTASVNKAITAETALRLASKGVIDLDEPIADYFVHPDLADDSRHKLLTPRILLTHQAGFLNWPYAYENGKLAFIDEPGNGSYNYAGIGFRIFAKFLEKKLEKPFPDIVREEIFEPIGMTNSTNSHDIAKTFPNIVTPVTETGAFQTDYEFKTDYWSAADDLFVSVEDYAAFLIATINNEGVNNAMAHERTRIQTAMASDKIWGCGVDAVDPCPEPYGHGIGWFVFGYEDGLVVHHGGNDQSEGAIGYYEPASGDGGVIFVNSPKGVQLWPEIADVVDPEQKLQGVFHDLIRKFFPEANQE
ncbi:MAG: serine hydrolase domain-containing protein [Parvularculaceae bacterium]